MRKVLRRTHTRRGVSVLLVLVFTGVFITLLSSLSGFIFMQQRLQIGKLNSERAVQIAEAGLDYYKWFLAHNPNDLTNGTGQPGPYVHTYADPEGDTTGSFSLEVEGSASCDTVSAIDITSTGWTSADPNITRTVYARYARPSVAEYAYILNSNVWAGSDRVIIGPYHSNGGIRMDGDNRSTVSSAVSTWQCTSSFGCSQTTQKDGIFGAGDHPELWSFPVPPIDFVGLTVDLSAMEAIAESQGLHFNPYGGNSDQRGYHFIFKNDGTVDVYRVTQTSSVWGYHPDTLTWQIEYHIIDAEQFVENYVIPSACPVIFAESKLWIEGVVKGKITVASANLTNPNVDTDVVLNGNLTYASSDGSDGSDGITVIGERSVLIPLLSPSDMALQGIFIAQKGYFGRNHYVTSGSHKVPSAYNSYVKQDTLTLTGTIVSNGREGTKWSSDGVFASGYNQRNNSYDRSLAVDPPPLTPYVSDDYHFIEWRED